MQFKVRVIGKSYTVTFLEELPDDNSGYHDGDDLEITIKEGLPKDNLADTILHELIHAVDLQMRIGLKEEQVCQLAAGLIALFRDNPELYKTYIE